MAKYTNSTKKFNKSQKINFLLCHLFLVLMAGVDLVLLDKLNIPVWLYELIFVFSLLIYLVWLLWGFGNYKAKYFFLGEQYKNQLNHLKYLQKYIPSYHSYLTPQKAKHNYRLYGDILKYPWSIYKITPLDILSSVAYGADQNNDKEWKNFLLFCLYENIVYGGGIDRFFEYLTTYYDIPFSKLKSDFGGIPEFPDKLKRLLTGTRAKKTYDYNKRFDKLSEEEFDEIRKLETNFSPLANNFEDELFSAVERLAMEKYKQIYKLYKLNENTTKVFINSDNDIRYSIWFDKKSNAYRISAEKFSPLTPDITPARNTFSWQSIEGYGLYATEELAENEIADKISGFEVIEIE